MTIAAHPAAHACAVVSTGTIVAYEVRAPREIAQSVRDEWTPHGIAPWVALEIFAPGRVRSQRIAVASRRAHGVLAATTR